MDPDGSNQTRLTYNPGEDKHPSWSSDGSKIAFSGRVNDGFDSIYVMNADGSGRKRLTSEGMHAEHPAWSPDGTKIAFSDVYGGIYVIGANEKIGWPDIQQKKITPNDRFYSEPSWSPDGAKLAFSGIGGGTTPNPFDIWVADADGGDLTNLTNTFPNGPVGGRGIYEVQSDWGPNDRIVYQLHDTTDASLGEWDLYSIDPDGTDRRPLLFRPNQQNFPSWSPDGNKLVFQGDGSPGWEIFSLDPSDPNVLNGGGITMLTPKQFPDNEYRRDNDEDADWGTATKGLVPIPQPPETSITGGPINGSTINETMATFDFSSSLGGDEFECSLDERPFENCTAPKKYANLTNGSHTLLVRAVDSRVGPDLTTASRTWTVDTTPPDTTTTSGPANGSTTTSTSASFSFSSEQGATFECSLDDAAFSECNPSDNSLTTKNYSNLSFASHTFKVRAKDAAGNVDPTPATRAWTVQQAPDTTQPTVSLTAPNDGAIVDGTGVSLSADASDNVGVAKVEFLVNGNVVATDASSPYSASWDSENVPDGRKTARPAPSTRRATRGPPPPER